jgi:hypothetical protein
MAAIAWSDVTNFASGLSSVSSGAQTVILAHVNETLDTEKWGGESSPKLKYARILLAAHFGTLTLQGASAGGGFGIVTGESAGGLSRQYLAFSPDGTDPTFDKTVYGQQYRTLLRGTMARIGFAG